MKKFLCFVLLALLACSGICHAQTLNLQTGHENITSMEGLWRFHKGNNHIL